MAGANTRVLIVDDDKDSAQTIANILSFEGITADVVTSGNAAILKLKEYEYSVFFVDLCLPDIEGIELIQHSNKQHPDMQAVIVTGHASLESAIQAIHHKVYDYITKPFSNDRLRIVARNAMAKYDLLKENTELVNRLMIQEEDLQHKIVHATEQLRLANEKLQEQARTDELTGLFNYRYFHERLEGEVYKALRYQQPLSLMMIDIDRFKRINDTLGHPVGDAILHEVGNLIKENMRNIDFVARCGGDEYVAILVQTNGKSAMIAGEKLRQIIAQASLGLPTDVSDKGLTVSIGIASLPEHGITKDELNTRTDQALYRAKNEGRNRVSLPPETSTIIPTNK